MNEIYTDSKGVARCHWCSTAPEFPAYHDLEWGFIWSYEPKQTTATPQTAPPFQKLKVKK